jgi:hypothetical protein
MKTESNRQHGLPDRRYKQAESSQDTLLQALVIVLHQPEKAKETT